LGALAGAEACFVDDEDAGEDDGRGRGTASVDMVPPADDGTAALLCELLPASDDVGGSGRAGAANDTSQARSSSDGARGAVSVSPSLHTHTYILMFQFCTWA